MWCGKYIGPGGVKRRQLGIHTSTMAQLSSLIIYSGSYPIQASGKISYAELKNVRYQPQTYMLTRLYDWNKNFQFKYY